MSKRRNSNLTRIDTDTTTDVQVEQEIRTLPLLTTKDGRVLSDDSNDTIDNFYNMTSVVRYYWSYRLKRMLLDGTLDIVLDDCPYDSRYRDPEHVYATDASLGYLYSLVGFLSTVAPEYCMIWDDETVLANFAKYINDLAGRAEYSEIMNEECCTRNTNITYRGIWTKACNREACLAELFLSSYYRDVRNYEKIPEFYNWDTFVTFKLKDCSPVIFMYNSKNRLLFSNLIYSKSNYSIRANNIAKKLGLEIVI